MIARGEALRERSTNRTSDKGRQSTIADTKENLGPLVEEHLKTKERSSEDRSRNQHTRKRVADNRPPSMSTIRFITDVGKCALGGGREVGPFQAESVLTMPERFCTPFIRSGDAEVLEVEI
jgi:hypothetical protein